MDEPRFDVLSFLAEPGRPASVATVTGVAVMVATFSPPDDVRQVRMTGPARLAAARDDDRVRRIYDRYVPEWTPDWAEQATSENYRLWSMTPERGMAVAYPGLAGGPPFHWTGPDAFQALGSNQEWD